MPVVARVPDKVGPESYGGYASWKRWPGVNCFGGRGGSVIPSADPAPGVMNLSKCMDLCDSMLKCDGVQTQDGTTTACWLRTEVDVQDCYSQPPWIMYTPERGASIVSWTIAGGSHSLPRTMLLIVEIVMVICIICLCVYLVKKKKLLCFKEKPPPKTEEEVKVLQEFENIDKSGDGVITLEEFVQFKHAEQEQRMCGSYCSGREEKPKEKPDEKPKQPEGHWEYVVEAKS